MGGVGTVDDCIEGNELLVMFADALGLVLIVRVGVVFISPLLDDGGVLVVAEIRRVVTVIDAMVLRVGVMDVLVVVAMVVVVVRVVSMGGGVVVGLAELLQRRKKSLWICDDDDRS